MNQPWYGQQPMPSGDPYAAWAQQRGWQFRQGGPANVLGMVPGVPFGEYGRKRLLFAGWGAHQGLPAVTMRVGFKVSSPGHNAVGVGATVNSHELWLAVLEVPAPLPALEVQKRKDTLTKLGSVRHWGKLFQGNGIEFPDLPEMARYRVEASNEQFARWLMTPEVLTMMVPPTHTLSPDQLIDPNGWLSPFDFLFAFAGRRIVVWSDVRGPRAREMGVQHIDRCLDNAFWLYQRVPQQVYNDPSGVEADRAGAPVQELVSQLSR